MKTMQINQKPVTTLLIVLMLIFILSKLKSYMAKTSESDEDGTPVNSGSNFAVKECEKIQVATPRPPNILNVATYEPIQDQAIKDAMCSCLETLPKGNAKEAEKPNKDMMFFTKIMKTATSTLQNVHRILSSRNKFVFWDIEPPKYRGQNQTKIALEILLPKCPRLVNSHHRFIDFTESGFRNPTYVSIVREPLHRIQSSFHFERTTMRFSHSEEKLKSWEGKSFEYCLESGDPDCDLPGCVQTAFFCGFSPVCNACDRNMLNLAKLHIEKYYPVVGVMESMNKSIIVMEKVNPNFYSGAMVAYMKDMEGYQAANKGKDYKDLSEAFVNKPEFRERYAPEYELYEYLSHRLEAQYKAHVLRDS